MNGPQHYTAGEEALAEAELTSETLKFERLVQVASVHFQAAQVAATFDAASANYYGGPINGETWRNATAEGRAR